MADELPRAGGQILEQGVEVCAVKAAGGGDADAAVGGGEAVLARELEKRAVKGAECCDLELAEERAAGEAGAPRGFKRVADGGDSAGRGGADEGAGDAREEVGVFVGVDVADTESGALQGADLGGGFALDVGFGDAAALEGKEEAGQGVAQAARWCEERGDAGECGEGCAVDEDDMAADVKGGMSVGCLDGVLKGGATGHEGGGGKGAGGVELRDGAVDARGEAEIVCVEEKAGQHAWALEDAEPPCTALGGVCGGQ